MANRRFHKDGTAPAPVPNVVLVFGSNLLGFHYGGAARLAAEQFGAKTGVDFGLTGCAFAIATCTEPGGDRVSMSLLQRQVEWFKDHLREEAQFTTLYFVTRVGCDIAGFKDEDVAPLFRGCHELANCSFPDTWEPLMYPELAKVGEPDGSYVNQDR